MLEFVRKRNKILSAYKETFATPAGKIVLSDLMKSLCFMSSTIGETPEQTYYNEGARAVVLRILKTLDAKPEDYKELIDNGEVINEI